MVQKSSLYIHEKYIFPYLIAKLIDVVHQLIHIFLNLIFHHYTPEFNPIELIFNKLKTEFKKLDHKNIYNDIKKCLNKICKEDVINSINHSLKIINSYK